MNKNIYKFIHKYTTTFIYNNIYMLHIIFASSPVVPRNDKLLVQPRRPAHSCAPGSNPNPAVLPKFGVFCADMTQRQQPTNQPTNHPTNQPTNQPPTHPTNQPTNQPNLTLFFRGKNHILPLWKVMWFGFCLYLCLWIKCPAFQKKGGVWNNSNKRRLIHHGSGIKTPQSIYWKWMADHISSTFPANRMHVSNLPKIFTNHIKKSSDSGKLSIQQKNKKSSFTQLSHEKCVPPKKINICGCDLVLNSKTFWNVDFLILCEVKHLNKWHHPSKSPFFFGGNFLWKLYTLSRHLFWDSMFGHVQSWA